MAVHISLRLAWHNDGWNGHICKDPKSNIYCVGQHSYPGTSILENRDIDLESKSAEKHCSECKFIPPCSFSINAFGDKPVMAAATPPVWFNDDTQVKKWQMSPATASVWNYEDMYGDDVLNNGDSSQTYNYAKRLENAKKYFSSLRLNETLIFYYSNYSNPFSEDENKNYIIVGVSRLKMVGEIMYYDGTSQQNRDKYAGGFVWQMPITSHYPDEGFKIPYHLYMDNPEILKGMITIPENSRNFKYATRAISDDDALILIEQLLATVNYLININDKSENWIIRKSWLESLLGELWKNRGIYPGFPSVLRTINFTQAIPYFKKATLQGQELTSFNCIIDFLENDNIKCEFCSITENESKNIKRQWRLKSKEQRQLLRDIIPLFDISHEQIEKILADDRGKNGIISSVNEIINNPYILTEQYIGDGPDDFISFNKIDNGLLPSPELGVILKTDKDSPERFRALVVNKLKQENKHSFLGADKILSDINFKMDMLPEWKTHHFSIQYFEVDEKILSESLVIRTKDDKKYIYLKSIYDDEREIEKQVKSLSVRPDIKINKPVTDEFFNSLLYDSESVLAKKTPDDYEKSIEGQVNLCSKIFLKPIAVISGSAGTGKTHIIKTIIDGIEKSYGSGVSFHLLAPTGKAADRIREKTGKKASTIHSFLASNGWLNNNYTFKRSGGKKAESINTYIIDEASMLDLELTATLFKSIDWNTVQRLFFVGDPNQLPPIGRGKIFSDIIEYLKKVNPESVGELKINIRQMENKCNDQGTGILDLASIYIRGINSTDDMVENSLEGSDLHPEEILKKIQEGGDIYSDLRILYWSDTDDLEKKLVDTFIYDLEKETGAKINPDKPYELWNEALTDDEGLKRSDFLQILSPYRSELFGTSNINSVIQKIINKHNLQNHGSVGGITYFDKIIQIYNRPKSNPYWGYNFETRKNEKIEIFNGEMGFTVPHAFDKNWKWPGFRMSKFQTQFSRRKSYRIDFTSESSVTGNIELAYAISVHKSQGSDFDIVYLIIPKSKMTLLSTELLYTGITRARTHLTLFIEDDISPLLSLMRPEKSHLLGINSSTFVFSPISDELLNISGWYEEGKIHKTLTEYMVRSKSEVIIANMLFEREIPFKYEIPLYAKDGTMYLPDFTIQYQGKTFYWEHLGLLEETKYKQHWEKKEKWYKKHFPDQLVITKDTGKLSKDADSIIKKCFND